MNKDFVSLRDLSPNELSDLLSLAQQLKAEQKAGKPRPLLADKNLGMIFQKPSLRTRVSFEVGMKQLGGDALYLSPNEIQLGVRESVADVARVLSRMVDGIMARVFAHQDIVDLARYATVPVINGLSDLSHPCQGLADLLTVQERFGRLKGLKLVYVGDGNNVTHSLMLGGALAGMNLVVATPRDYAPAPIVVQWTKEIAAETGATYTWTADCQEAVRGADVIYTDTWASMGQEAEAEKRKAIFPPYQVNAALVRRAAAHVIVMHCLPAHRGQEITDEVMDGPHSAVLDQAENRIHAQKAILVRLLS